MVGCEYVIYQDGKLRLGPLGLQMKPSAPSLLSLEATSKDYYSILDLLVSLLRLPIRVGRFFHRLIGLIVISLGDPILGSAYLQWLSFIRADSNPTCS